MTKQRRPEPGLGLDENAAENAGESAADGAPEAAAARRPRQDSRPECPDHKTQMTAYASSAMFTYYRCPQDGCGRRDKRVRKVGPLANLYGNGKSGGGAAEPEEP